MNYVRSIAVRFLSSDYNSQKCFKKIKIIFVIINFLLFTQMRYLEWKKNNNTVLALFYSKSWQ